MDCLEELWGIFLVIDNKLFYVMVECIMCGLDLFIMLFVVMLEVENINGGLVLVLFLMVKKFYGIFNVNCQCDLLYDNYLIVVLLWMNMYIEKNIEVNNIYCEFMVDEDLLLYLIDELILDIIYFWKLFGDDLIVVVKKI